MAEERTTPYIFVSYASADRARVLPVVAALERAGVAVWLDRGGIAGGASYAAAIAAAIKGAATVVLMASPASLASRNVRQELALGWRYERPYLPLLLDPITIPDDLAYWLEAAQWVEVLDKPEREWLPAVLAALRGLGVALAMPAPLASPAAPAGPPVPFVRPETRYARSGDLSIAYQVVGNGPVDFVYVNGTYSHVEYAWEEPSQAQFLRRLAAFSRLILFDKRGTGMSDPIPGASTMEERMDDIRAVMDAAGAERAVLYGLSEGALLAALFAATYPERTAGLLLWGGMASVVGHPDIPWRPPAEEARRQFEARIPTIRETWGSAAAVAQTLSRFMPSVTNNEHLAQWAAGLQRLSFSPGAFIALWRMNLDLDVRHALPAIRVPTLVLHRTGDLVVPIADGRYLADHIPSARFIELPGDSHLPNIGDMESALAPIEAFVAEVRDSATPDLVLATVLRAAVAPTMSEVAAVDALDRHRALAQRAFERHRGRTFPAGDNALLATFDGPARAVRCAQALVREAATLGLTARAGLHTGECALGDERAEGPAIALAAGVLAHAGPGEVLVSSTVKDLVAGSGLTFAARGVAALAGLPGEWHLFAALVREQGNARG